MIKPTITPLCCLREQDREQKTIPEELAWKGSSIWLPYLPSVVGGYEALESEIWIPETENLRCIPVCNLHCLNRIMKVISSWWLHFLWLEELSQEHNDQSHPPLSLQLKVLERLSFNLPSANINALRKGSLIYSVLCLEEYYCSKHAQGQTM